MARIGLDVPDRVVGDAKHLRQVLYKVADNAVKFTEEGHVVIGVSAKTIHDQSLLSLSVSDSGVGMRPDCVEDIFTPFHQASMGIARQHDGLGLGLSICKFLTDLMGGKISVTTSPGTGSVFEISLDLPIAQDRCPISARLPKGCKVGLFGRPVGACQLNPGRAHLWIGWNDTKLYGIGVRAVGHHF